MDRPASSLIATSIGYRLSGDSRPPSTENVNRSVAPGANSRARSEGVSRQPSGTIGVIVPTKGIVRGLRTRIARTGCDWGNTVRFSTRTAIAASAEGRSDCAANTEPAPTAA